MWVAAQLGVRCVFSLQKRNEIRNGTRGEKRTFSCPQYLFLVLKIFSFGYEITGGQVGKVENKEFIVKIGKQPSGNASTISESALLIYFTKFGEENG